MNARQSLICGSSIVLCLLFANNAQAYNVYRVGEVIKGKEYNDVLKWWIERDFSIWVGINDGGYKHILFKAETGLGDATVALAYSITLRNEFGSLIEKAIEWSDVARKNNADTTRGLGCFGGLYRDPHCEETGATSKENQLGLSFFAAQGGQQTNLIINIVDEDNEFLKASLYLNPLEMEKLLINMHQIEEAFEKATETLEKQELFK